MTTIVFVGPTLSREKVLRVLPEAEPHGPAACGDIYRATRRGATTIVLIDGYFDQELAVWHKEVLWALARGVRVYGGASMGALRAAELERFGMIGVGRIFDWYVSGTIEADDEVAVAHESEERGYRVVSEAMVNLRATFLAAESAGVIGPDTRDKLIQIGRDIFYPSRSMREVLSRATRSVAEHAELDSLRRWLGSLPEGIVNQKRTDTLAVLERVRADLASQQNVSAIAGFCFEYTEVWHELTRQIETEGTTSRSVSQTKSELTSENDVKPAATDEWTELVVGLLSASEPKVADALRREAERRAALLECAAHRMLETDAVVVQTTANELRHERRLLTLDRTQHWLSERGLDLREFSEWMGEDSLISNALTLVAPASRVQLRRAVHGSTDPVVLKAISDVNEGMQRKTQLERSGNDEQEQAIGGSGAKRALSGAES